MTTVNLTVHKNTRAKRQAREVTNDFLLDVRSLCRSKDIDGYVVVAWDSDQKATAHWNSGSLPGALVGEFAKRCVERTIAIRDAEKVFSNPEDAS